MTNRELKIWPVSEACAMTLSTGGGLGPTRLLWHYTKAQTTHLGLK